MVSKKSLAALAVAGVVVVLYLFLKAGGGTVAAPRGPAGGKNATAPQNRDWINVSFQRAVTASGSGLSLAAQIDALIASKKPQDAFMAYELVRRCMDLAQLGSMPFWDIDDGRQELTPDENKAVGVLCEGLTERMRTSRLDHLALAAKARIPGADSILLEEGPFGDKSALDTRPNDPLVLEWKKNVAELLREHAEAGELGALMTLNINYGMASKVFEKDTTLALGYALASRQIKLAISADMPVPVEDALIGVYQSGSSPAQIASANDAAKTIVDNWHNAHQH